ncbi:MAG TPA: hypothetical protein VKM54_24895 [Myxococcota bacterium]|nr:hypothetical protein [Myxococcota bacterium]
MAQKTNVFDTALRKLFDALADIVLLCRATHMQIENAASLANQALEEGRAESASSGRQASTSIEISTALSIPDLFKPSHHRLSYQPQSRHDEEMLKLIRELDNRLQAQCIGLAYEAFAAFLKEMSANLFFCMRKTWTPIAAKAFHKSKPKYAKAAAKNTPEYFSAYVKYLANYNSNELLKELRDMLPDIVSTGEKNWFGDLFEHYYLVSVIRHLTVHRGGEIGPQSFRKLGAWGKGVATDVTQQSALTGRATLLPTVTLTAHLIEGLTALAHVIYRAVSKKLGMKSHL